MKRQRIFWALPLLGMLAMPAVADHRLYDDDRGNRFEQRLDRQDWRIRQGVRSGELTHGEAKRLRKQQRQIARAERRFSGDGYLDRYERRTLRRELDAASDRIYRLKHNDRYRGHREYGHDRHDYHSRYESKRQDHHRGRDHSGWAVVLNLWDHL